MIENIGDFVNWQALIDGLVTIFWKLVVYPFKMWNSLPAWLRWTFYIFLFLLAAFFWVITLKYKDAWRYRI